MRSCGARYGKSKTCSCSAVRIQSTRVTEDLWEMYQKHRVGDGIEKEYGECGVRSIERAWPLAVQWYKAKGVNKGKSMVYDTMANSQGGSYRMPMNKFKDAKDREREAIEKAEDEYEKIRHKFGL